MNMKKSSWYAYESGRKDSTIRPIGKVRKEGVFMMRDESKDPNRVKGAARVYGRKEFAKRCATARMKAEDMPKKDDAGDT